ncbi:nucleotidyltransferase substrate binding protein [Synechococcus lacustris]|uniref:nucleotidyltransferase substrate binding protein n=1 Tax=Synechococcus lacustris TaxID=2116544 RepID=UPI0020CDCE02|nr:nucleotidyltransferase substrate binding protein [Synechococcus lacustris]MCP9812318.1 nucleotidyltransferase substrate binding protein [Synechococcus lacustris Maggiore-St4-Slac]
MTEDIRWQQRFSNFQLALSQLETSFEPPELNGRDQQGLIKAFEYTFELAWNSLRDLFSSRAMVSYKPGSDIDLCLEGKNLNHNNRLLILSAVGDLLSPWRVDLVIMHQLDQNLLNHINRVGHCIWRKSTPKDLSIHHQP